MKRVLRILVFGLIGLGGLTPVVFGQSKRPSIGLEVKSVATGGKVRTQSGASVGNVHSRSLNRTVASQGSWTTRNRESGITLEIGVRNFGRTDLGIVVQTLFLAKSADGSGEPFLLNSTDEPLAMNASEYQKISAVSDVARSATERSFHQGTTRSNSYGPAVRVWSASNLSQGAKLAGWIVRVLADGQVVEMKASSPSLEQLAKNPAAVEKLMAPMQTGPQVPAGGQPLRLPPSIYNPLTR